MPSRGSPIEDVQTTLVVGPHPVAAGRPPAGQLPALGPLPAGHVRAVERQVFAGPDHRPQFEQRPVGQCGVQLGWRVPRPKAAPGHEIGTRRDHGGRTDLEQSQLARHVKQPGRPRAIQDCAHTTMRRASRRESSWTVTTGGYGDGPTGNHLPTEATSRPEPEADRGDVDGRAATAGTGRTPSATARTAVVRPATVPRPAPAS